MIQKSQQQLDAYFKNQKDGVVIYEEVKDEYENLLEGSLKQISCRLSTKFNVLLQNDAFLALTGISTCQNDFTNISGPENPIFVDYIENADKIAPIV